MNRILLYVASFGFFAGVAARSFVHLQTRPFIWLFFLSLGAIFIFYKLQKARLLMAILFICLFSLGFLRMNSADTPPGALFEKAVGANITLQAIVSQEPVRKPDGTTEFILETKASNAGSEQFAKIFVSTKLDTALRYGEIVEATGLLEHPQNFLTDQGKRFDYIHYLKVQGISYVMRNPKTTLISSGGGALFWKGIFWFKEKFESALGNSIPQPQSFLAQGLILGDRAAIPDALRQSFASTGTVHIVTVGGYHITLVADWILAALAFLGTSLSAILCLVLVMFYILVTGAAATTVRAGIMASLVLLARHTNRVYHAGNALLVAALFMVVWNPFILVFDVSFELSAIATSALILLSPELEPHFKWIKRQSLRHIVSATVAMYIFTLPFLLYKIGILSLVSLPANILVVPAVPIGMLSSFATGFAGIISATLGVIVGKVSYLILLYMIGVIGFFDKLPFASLTISNFPFVFVILVYAVFFGLLMQRKQAVLVVPLILTLLIAGFLQYRKAARDAAAEAYLKTLLAAPTESASKLFTAKPRMKTSDCHINGPYPDPACTPGAVFPNELTEKICVKGYTKTVRSVSTAARKKVFAEYGIAYPVPKNSYEVDHFIPLALGGSNDIANLFPEAAAPAPGFHEKDVVEIYLYESVCNGKFDLEAARRQIGTDWLAVYNNMTSEQIQTIRKKYHIPDTGSL